MRAGLLLSVAFAGILVARSAHAGDATPSESTEPAALEAREHHRRGVELYDEGDLRLALVEFERAYAIGRSYKVLFNIGQVQFQLMSYAKARFAFEQYLALGGDRLEARRRADVERDLGILRLRTATLTIRVNVPDAEISINDAPASSTLERAVVDAGTLRVKVSHPGYGTVVRDVSLAGGDTQTVDVTLVRTKPDVVVTNTTKGLPGHVVAAWIVGGVLTAGTVGTAIAAKAASSDYERQREAPISGAPTEARVSLERQRDLVRGLAMTTDVLGISTLIAGGLALYFTLREPRRDGSRVQAGIGRADFALSF